MGGPVEFDELRLAHRHMPNLRDWQDGRKITRDDISRLAENLPLLSYESLRPEVAPYGPWSPKAAAGTLTDDSRHKIILLSALRDVHRTGVPTDTPKLAKAYLDFDHHPSIARHHHYAGLNKEGHAEFRSAASWILGERDTDAALPPERLWAGVPTCCGQMTLLPLAAAMPGRPEDAYLAAFRLGFFDNGPAKDINSSIVAALSVALTLDVDASSARSRHAAWRRMYEVMQATDPFRYADSPYTEKPASQWVRFAQDAAKRADGQPKRLYRILEEECRQQHWWEAQLILATAICCSELCNHDPLASMHMVLDFGHDTDSGAALLGAFVGALFGPQIFPEEYSRAVAERLRIDFLEDLDEWVGVLSAISDRQKYPNIVIAD